MVDFITQEKIIKSFNKLLVKADTVKLAIAFWGESSVKHLGLDGSKNIQVICNLISGGTNPKVIDELEERGIEIKHNPRLHSKVYWTDKGAIVGSSNASANGLSYEDKELTGWIEANVLIEEYESELLDNIEIWFDELWEESEEITADIKKEAEKCWLRKRNNRITQVSKNISILEALESDPQDFKDRNIIFAFYRINVTSTLADKLFEKEIEKTGNDRQNLSFYEGWEELPADTQVLDFYIGPHGGSHFGGLYHIPNNPYRGVSKGGKQTSITLCERLSDIDGRKFTSKDQNKIKQKISLLLEAATEGNEEEDTAGTISLYDAKDILFPKSKVK